MTLFDRCGHSICPEEDVLAHLGEATSPPRLMPARGPTPTALGDPWMLGSANLSRKPSRLPRIRVRSANRLVTSNFPLALGTLVRWAQRAPGFPTLTRQTFAVRVWGRWNTI